MTLMTGGEIAAVGKAAGAVGKKALGQDQKTGEVLLRVAEDTPEMRAAARSMAARTAVKERVKLKLYQPFARMLGVSKEYFGDTFPQEMGAKIADIPEENLITPSPSVAVPALQGLSYTFGEPSLKELFLNLLATASDDRRAGVAHPAFADVIKQLSPPEARVLEVVLARLEIPAVRLKNLLPASEYQFNILLPHLLPYADEEGHPVEAPQLPVWVDNWQRLGLVEMTYKERMTGENTYDWVKTMPEYRRFDNDPAINLDFDKGGLRVTGFGQYFYRAVTGLSYGD
jgi:hypothetical protein